MSFSVERGQTLCILGRSGVGKSVSLRMLMGFLKPDSGSIRVEGQEITELMKRDAEDSPAGDDGLQNGALFDSLTVRENVAFPLRERGEVTEEEIQQEVVRLIGLVGAEDAIDSCLRVSPRGADVLWRLRARWPPSLTWCSMTNQPRWSIRSSLVVSAT